MGALWQDSDGGCGGDCVACGLASGYTAWQTSQAEASASAYQQALKSDDVVAALEAQLGQLTDGYAMLAQFQIAAEQAASDDFAAAEASYLALASDASLDPLYQQAATLLSVMVAPQDADVSALAARLSDLETAMGLGRQWRWRQELAWHYIMAVKMPRWQNTKDWRKWPMCQLACGNVPNV